MEIVFGLKPLVDMLYQYQFLDVTLMIICVFCFFSPKFKIEFRRIDIVILALMLLFLFSFMRNTNGWAQFLKIESSFVLYFLGRGYIIKFPKILKSIQIGFIPVLLFTFISYLDGSGFVNWGSINTFRGYYFFKTDLALAMTQCFAVYSFYSRYHILQRWLILMLCLLFVLFANARIYYLIMVFVLFLTISNYYEKKTGRIILKLNAKFLYYAFFLILITIYVMAQLNQLIGEDYLMLDMSEDLLSGTNTQGRDVVWAEIYDIFAKQDLFTRFIGIDLCSDISPTLGYNSHDLYLKILFSTGYIGSVIFVLFVIFALRTISQIEKQTIFYIVICFFLMYLLGGVSYITIESTQGTWITMFLIGFSVRINCRKSFKTYKKEWIRKSF